MTRCDLCKHVPANTKSFKSPWDGRKWEIRKHITCTSTDNVGRRWTKHKYDWKHNNRTCMLASHGQNVAHPADPELRYLEIIPIDKRKVRKTY